jgi:hypothetical protein
MLATGLRAIVVSVDFADLLAVTLPYNRHHFEDVLIVTSTADKDTPRVARDYQAKVFATESFYEPGAVFNKHKSLEEGLDYMGRYGWICLLDADVLWPCELPSRFPLSRGRIYGPSRREMKDLSGLVVPDESKWEQFPIWPPCPCPLLGGFSQIFHADDAGHPPWHDLNWRHAGGGDTVFQQRWPIRNRIRLPFAVLHLGPVGVNWCGRTMPYLDGSVPPESGDRMTRLLEFVKAPGFPRRDPRERYLPCEF